jgi:hypothetical protein
MSNKTNQDGKSLLNLTITKPDQSSGGPALFEILDEVDRDKAALQDFIKRLTVVTDEYYIALFTEALKRRDKHAK